METINNRINIMDTPMDVFDFVSVFLGIQVGQKISRSYIIRGINRYIVVNRDVLLKHPIPPCSFMVVNELKDFFKDCSLIKDLRITEDEKDSARKRGIPYKKNIIPEIMKHTDVMTYLKFCERKYSALNIPTKKDLENQRRFINSISDELISRVSLFPKIDN